MSPGGRGGGGGGRREEEEEEEGWMAPGPRCVCTDGQAVRKATRVGERSNFTAWHHRLETNRLGFKHNFSSRFSTVPITQPWAEETV